MAHDDQFWSRGAQKQNFFVYLKVMTVQTTRQQQNNDLSLQQQAAANVKTLLEKSKWQATTCRSVLKHKSADCKMSSPMPTTATPSKSGTATTTTNPATSNLVGKNPRTNEKQQLCSFTHYFIYFVDSLWLPDVFFSGNTTVPMLQCPLHVRSKICNLVWGVSDRSPSLREGHRGSWTFNYCWEIGYLV